jgi:hypothetical protein
MFQFLTGRNGNFQELVHENLKTYFIRQNFLQLIRTWLKFGYNYSPDTEEENNDDTSRRKKDATSNINNNNNKEKIYWETNRFFGPPLQNRRPNPLHPKL